MSRNLSETHCPICKRGFEPTSIGVDEASKLMTEGQYLKAIDWEDCPYKGNFGYGWTGKGGNFKTHFLRIQCPDCGRLFAGWYQRMGSKWVLFDSSYYFAFNDEPDELDEVDARDVQREQPPEPRALRLPWHVESTNEYDHRIIDCDGHRVASDVNIQDAQAIVEVMNRSAK